MRNGAIAELGTLDDSLGAKIAVLQQSTNYDEDKTFMTAAQSRIPPNLSKIPQNITIRNQVFNAFNLQKYDNITFLLLKTPMSRTKTPTMGEKRC